jgi:hypothetical protein
MAAKTGMSGVIQWYNDFNLSNGFILASQVENSRQMYRCIMEEVARYLEKCHFNFEMIQKRERDKVIERSKSIAYIAKSKTLNGVTESDGRARSSSNLTSLNTLPQKQSKSGTILGDISYSAFKDFTW